MIGKLTLYRFLQMLILPGTPYFLLFFTKLSTYLLNLDQKLYYKVSFYS